MCRYPTTTAVMIGGRILIACWLLIGLADPVAAKQWVRVGIYDNPPMVSQDETGHVEGIFPELLRYIAAEEGWRLEFVSGCLTEGLDRLEQGSIDLLLPLAYTEARCQYFDFTHETIISNWGQVYVAPGSEIESILDLDGKLLLRCTIVFLSRE